MPTEGKGCDRDREPCAIQGPEFSELPRTPALGSQGSWGSPPGSGQPCREGSRAACSARGSRAKARAPQSSERPPPPPTTSVQFQFAGEEQAQSPLGLRRCFRRRRSRSFDGVPDAEEQQRTWPGGRHRWGVPVEGQATTGTMSPAGVCGMGDENIRVQPWR